MMNRSNGRPEPEVIMNFGDGFAYSKAKMEEAFRSGGVLDKFPTRGLKDSANCKREDVELIVHELEIPRVHAEKALAEHGGDIVKALQSLILTPKI